MYTVPITYDLSIAQKNSEEFDRKKKFNKQAFNNKQIITEQSEKNAEQYISDNNK